MVLFVKLARISPVRFCLPFDAVTNIVLASYDFLLVYRF
jgi:hypothetical protein